ncbi:YqaA family protein [Bordetella avium]|uniref:YqaA family protein n=1 Tax=Bordetella avium TaxID=521 RepID=UPI0039FCD41F
MEQWLLDSVDWLLAALALPAVGLPAIFLICTLSATLLPLGSEAFVFGYVTLQPDMFWPTIAVATLGNTLGGVISYAMGAAGRSAYQRWRESHPHEGDEQRDLTRRGRWNARAHAWLARIGPPAMLLAWLPGLGDPLCAVAGWLRLAFWPSTLYMALGKLLRYIVLTAGLLWVV